MEHGLEPTDPEAEEVIADYVAVSFAVDQVTFQQAFYGTDARLFVGRGRRSKRLLSACWPA